MKITSKIKEAGNLLDIQLLDHIILTPERDLYRGRLTKRIIKYVSVNLSNFIVLEFDKW
jgi:RadC-like JAB domain